MFAKYAQELERRKAAGTLRRLPEQAEFDLDFSSNDYLGLSQHPQVKAAAAEASLRYGVGSTGSRLVSGNLPLYEELEVRLAEHCGQEKALVFGGGFSANVGLLGCLMDRESDCFADRAVHASVLAGAQLSRARLRRFAHNDSVQLEKMLAASTAPRKFIVTESIFGMRGDRMHPELPQIAEKYGAFLYVDEAHSFGLEAGPQLPFKMGTFGKALGAFGGFCAASDLLCRYVLNTAPSFVYSTGLPPASVAALLEALKVLPTLDVGAPYRMARRFLPSAESHIVALEVADPIALSAYLASHSIRAVVIRPPTVPTAILRLNFTANHTEADVDRLKAALESYGT